MRASCWMKSTVSDSKPVRRRPSAALLHLLDAIRLIVAALVLSLPVPVYVFAAVGRIEPPRVAGQPYRFRPNLAVSESLQPFIEDITPGNDVIPDERLTGEIISRLSQLSDRMKAERDRAHAADFLLASSFRGGSLLPSDEITVARHPSLEIRRARAMASKATLDARAFAQELHRLLADFRSVAVAEFLVITIDFQQDKAAATTEVRYDIVGPGQDAWRVQRLGKWRLRWRREPSGWQVVEWTAIEHIKSRATAPIFAEVTTAAVGGNDAFRRLLGTGFDALTVTMDSVLARDSNGHHGVTVGDIDGDGFDDMYIAQPYGLPDRLFRARGDGTFEDVTEKAGLGSLDDTLYALFADVDNDGDQDLIITKGAGPLLFLNNGAGRFNYILGAFRVQKVLQGAPMGMAMADYDRDGYLDLYLCVYSYHYGAGEAKAGTPTPYHDALNGPPNVLYRNTGRGFVDVTSETGLDAGNNRYSFSASWSDYDGDGWPDLVVTNDFGRKNLYHNRGLRDGKVTFEDVAAQAGVEDHAAGMSVSWLDYDGDGRFDIYGGQMWSANGIRVTANAAFMPEATEHVHALYRHHAQGNTLLRNKGDGTFEDVTLKARVNMGRWTWSSGAVDFDSDGWEDLYCVNGMVTRAWSSEDLDWMFWGGVVARSPLIQATGTPYDDAWRSLNRLMSEHSVAGHHRNVFLRNDGQGVFDDVSGAVGLDLDEDGRSFAVLDFDHDGDPDIISLAPRSAPQLRVFRNDFTPRGSTIAVRISGTTSNRDAIGARVTVATDRLQRTKMVSAGAGFLSQHSKELLFGLGPSQQIAKLTVEWPSGVKQIFTDVPLNHRIRIEEGGKIRSEPYAAAPALSVDVTPPTPVPPPNATWLYEPFPVPDLTLRDLRGNERLLSDLREGRPAVVLFLAVDVKESLVALKAIAKDAEAIRSARISALAIALDPPEDASKVQRVAAGASSMPVFVAGNEAALGFAILHRHLFMNHPDLELPTVFLLDAKGRVVRVYRTNVDVSQILQDAATIEASSAERLNRARPFNGVSTSDPGQRDYVPYARDLLDQDLEAQAIVALKLATQGRPSASVLYRLGSLLVKTGQTAKAIAAYEEALILQPDLAEACNELGVILAQSGDIPGAIERFRAGIAVAPDYPEILTNLGYALLLTGQADEARKLYEKALSIQPDFPEALNNLGLLLGRAGEMSGAEMYFRKALEKRPRYGEAANNLAFVLCSRRQVDDAIRLLQEFIEKCPEAESTYIALAKILLSAGRRQDGLAVIGRLLKRNPTHALALEIEKAFK
jgi:tetratricopeptide (TPR) repeat protein